MDTSTTTAPTICPTCGSTVPPGTDLTVALAPHGPGASVSPAPSVGGRPLPPAPPLADRPVRSMRPRPAISGQGLLLGLGGLLLLSGAAVFVYVVWLLVGVAGQAALMVLVTCLAAVAADRLGRRGLRTAAETFATIACGLVLLDLAAAHHLDLFGFGDIPVWTYAAGAGALASALALAIDRVTVPSRAVYGPYAGALAAITPWCIVAAIAPHGSGLVLADGLAAAVDLALGGLVLGGIAAARSRRSTAVPLLGAGLVGAVTFGLADVALGYDLTVSRQVRAEAALLGLAVPAALALLAGPTGRRLRLPFDLRTVLRFATTGSFALAAGMVCFDAPWGVLAAIAALLAVLVIAPGAHRGGSWVTAVTVTAAVAQGILAAWMVGESPTYWPQAGAFMLALPALLWTVSALLRAARDRLVLWVGVAEGAAALAVGRLLLDRSEGTIVLTAIALASVNVVLLNIAARRDRTDRDALGVPRSLGLEAFGFLAGGGWIMVALGAAIAAGRAPWIEAVFWFAGAVLVVHSAAPRRLLLAHAGSLSFSAGVWVLLGNNGVHVVEAYTVPLAALLAVVGLVQARQHPGLPTFATAGPALGVLLAPSLAVAVAEGDAKRLAAVTIAGIALVVAGLQQRWQAPVSTGVGTLLVVALTQGGPLVGHLPSWMTLTVAGALLLTAGVRWESAVVTGRRAAVWYAGLR